MIKKSPLFIISIIFLFSANIAAITSCKEKTEPADKNQTKSNEQETGVSDDGAVLESIKGFSAYENKRFNFRIQYPANWKKMEDLTGVAFISPEQGQDNTSGVDASRENAPMEGFNLLFDKMTGKSMSLDQYKKIVLDAMKKYMKDFRLAESSETELDGIPAYRMTYTGTHQSDEMKYYSMFAVHNGIVYTLTFNAPVSRFDGYGDIVQTITNSFQFLEKKME